jgi:small subunit ribosomal protein S6
MATAEAIKTTQGAPRRAREYETIYILRSTIDPDEAERIAARVREVIDRLGGKLLKVDNWGRRRLAYPIQRASRGVFVYLQYAGYEDLVAELERNLRLLDHVIRYQTVMLKESVMLADYDVDPEQVAFLPIEAVDEEPELALAQRLGLEAAPRRARPDDAESDMGDDDMGDDDMGDDDGPMVDRH